MRYFIIFWLVGSFCFAQINESFVKANQLYNSGDYQKAISAYNLILDANQHSASLYYNIANCHYKLNEIALSIYYYEKALLLDPKDEDVITNLSFAQKMTVDSIQEIPENGLAKLFTQTINSLSLDGWAKRCVGIACLFVVLFLCYFLSYSETKKRLFFVSSGFVLILLISSLFLLLKKEGLETSSRPAIVFAKEIEVKTEPNLRAENAFMLHEGTKVYVIEKYDSDWSKIKLRNGETGWITNSELKEL